MIYLDSCLAIYLVEETAPLPPSWKTFLRKNSTEIFCISPLTELECLIIPLRLQNHLTITKFENWFRTVENLPIEDKVFRDAARIRADFNNLKTPDALHLATALHYNCNEFWTNDNRLNSVAPNIVKNILI